MCLPAPFTIGLGDSRSVRTNSIALEEVLRPTVEGLGYIMWGIDYNNYNNRASLCVYIDSSNGITVDDCAQVSNQLEGVLDVETLVPANCTLQVSSPGLDRILFYPEQFGERIGTDLDIKLRWPIQGRSRVRGKLIACSDTHFNLEVDQEEYELEFAQVSRARVVPNLN